MRTTVIVAVLIGALLLAVSHAAALSDDGVLLQGEVKKEVIAALTQLHEVRVAEAKVKRASEDLFEESTRPQITTEEEPDLIGDTVLELPVPVQTGFLLPPRTKWVSHYMDELDKLVPMLKEEVDDIVIPDANQAEAKQLYSHLTSDTKEIEQSLNSLKQLCAAKPYDQTAMAKASALIHLAVKDMEAARKQLYELLRKPAQA